MKRRIVEVCVVHAVDVIVVQLLLRTAQQILSVRTKLLCVVGLASTRSVPNLMLAGVVGIQPGGGGGILNSEKQSGQRTICLGAQALHTAACRTKDRHSDTERWLDRVRRLFR